MLVERTYMDNGAKGISNKITNKPLWQTSMGDQLMPTGCMWSLKTALIEDWICTFLQSAGVRGVKAAAVVISREGTEHGRVNAYAILEKDSPAFHRNGNTMANSVLAKKIKSGSLKPTEEFRKVIAALTGHANDVRAVISNGVIFVELNIFHVLGAMLLAERNIHDISIIDAKRVPGEDWGHIRVMKIYKTLSGKKSTSYNSIAMNLSR